jgi:hypothetical protein
MSEGSITANKTRDLLNTASLVANAAHPAFPTGTADPMVFAGDFTGAEIAGFEFECGALTTITALDATIQHSDDGTNWYTLKVLTQKTGAAKTYNSLADTDPKPMKYLRVNMVATGSYGSAATVQVSVKFCQPKAKGRLAPPGYKKMRE